MNNGRYLRTGGLPDGNDPVGGGVDNPALLVVQLGPGERSTEAARVIQSAVGVFPLTILVRRVAEEPRDGGVGLGLALLSVHAGTDRPSWPVAQLSQL